MDTSVCSIYICGKQQGRDLSEFPRVYEEYIPDTGVVDGQSSGARSHASYLHYTLMHEHNIIVLLSMIYLDAKYMPCCRAVSTLVLVVLFWMLLCMPNPMNQLFLKVNLTLRVVVG